MERRRDLVAEPMMYDKNHYQYRNTNEDILAVPDGRLRLRWRSLALGRDFFVAFVSRRTSKSEKHGAWWMSADTTAPWDECNARRACNNLESVSKAVSKEMRLTGDSKMNMLAAAARRIEQYQPSARRTRRQQRGAHRIER
ncbi:hypothetical protein BWQ96_08924 [Gracilariopsis chorda]|uniref:Uncharacterized protein n=1 Tax=Gracilariopsis chorda TaxID=448386 RepID=A0A2V3IGZ0_9FLOR|nr:hypothetical protein BWQ96_08924 [Gracilariopsis chorda]|eukprot:PXF41354.1 hypothetical protein BWQ96_08924 [Gracilariopsis chorda]